MTLELKQWKKILDTVNRDQGNIFEQIKRGVKEKLSRDISRVERKRL